MSWLRWAAHGLAASALTLLTQVGGALYLLALFLRRRLPGLRDRPRVALAACFVGLYGLAWFPIQAAASLTGRAGLPCAEQGALRTATPLYCIAHRHYVRAELLALAHDMARAVEQRHPGTVTLTLDAGFPFLDGFPLLPHLSHNDGRKLDLAFYYMPTATLAIMSAAACARPSGIGRSKRPGRANASLAAAGPGRCAGTRRGFSR